MKKGVGLKNDSASGKNVVVKSSFWYTISNFFLKGIGFITIPIFARLLSKEEFGYYNNFTAWLSVITIIGTLSLTTALIRGRFDFKKDLSSFISSILVLGSIWTLILYGLFFLNHDMVQSIFKLDFRYVTIMFLCVLFLPAYQSFQSVQRFEYKYKSVVAITIGVSVGSVVLSLVLMQTMENTLTARIIGAQVPTLLVSMFLYAYCIKKSRRIKLQYWKFSLLFAIPYVIHMLSNTVLNSIDRVMITSFCGAQETALYSMAYNIALIVSVLWDSMNTAYSPWLGDKLNEKNYDAIKKYSYGYISVFAIVLIGVMLFAPEGLYILGGREYVEAQYVIPPVMLGYLFVFLYSMYVNVEQYENRTGGMAIATGVAALINLVLNYVFIPHFGYIAAAYTTLVGYIFLFIFHFTIVRRMGLSKIYNFKFIVLVILIEGIFTLFITISYQFNFLRYALILIYLLVVGIVAYRNKKLLLNIFQK